MGGNYRCEFDKSISGHTIGVSNPGARQRFVSNVKNMLSALNEAHKEATGLYLWPNLSGNIDELLIFGGSTEHVFDSGITDEEFQKHKGAFSDLDIYIPQAQDRGITVMKLLNDMSGKMMGQIFKVICAKVQPDSLARSRGTNAIFQYMDGRGNPYIQFDFMPQPIPIEGDEQTIELQKDKKWVKFSHSSNWRDVQEKVKGVFHKYIMQALVNVASRLPAGHVITDKSTRDKFKISAGSEEDLRSHAFSVEKGLALNRLEKQDYVDPTSGVPLYKMLKPAQKTYTTDLDKIFSVAFGFDPDQEDIEKMRSFSGILEIMRDKMKPEITRKVIKSFVYKIFGKEGQELNTFSAAKDEAPKSAAINLIQKMGLGDILSEAVPDLEGLKSEYYEQFKVKMAARGSLTSDDEISHTAEIEESLRRIVRHYLNA